ncbi:MAG: dTMP kinase [Deferribacterota bacterium]|nr:dTMP kinase [Deferribacterota bacterium]
MKTVDRCEAKFIVIDGIDGCGKSTLSKKLYNYYKSLGKKIILTKEPGGSPSSKYLREYLLNSKIDITPITETLIFLADRYEHINKTIIPAINAGYNVICDRYTPSTYAYQVFGRNVDSSITDFLTKRLQILYPDITLIIDIDVKLAIKRKRSDKANPLEEKYELMGKDFLECVRKGFLWYAKNFDNTYIINGDKAVEASLKDALNIIDKALGKF